MKFKIRNREFFEKAEEDLLAPYATKSKVAHITRIYNEEEHPYRTAFQRDRDRIIHSRAFRRLKHKQQVFLISEGDHYRTRLTHTLEVSQLARTMAKALGLNEELVEAIALGHDLGHTPFGHVGEVVLDNILSGNDNLDGFLTGDNFGGFKHNYQSVRVVDLIEKKYRFDGLNLTSYVREGILKHTHLYREKYLYPDFNFQGLHFEIDVATTIEGQIVAICDEIAQRTHDLEDGVRAGLVELEQVRNVDIIALIEKMYGIKNLLNQDRYTYRNEIIRGLINFLVNDIISTSLKNIASFYQRKKRLDYFDEEIVRFSDQINPLQLQLNQFIYKEIIFKGRGHEINSQNKNIIRKLFQCILKNPVHLPKYIFNRIKKVDTKQQQQFNSENNVRFLRIIADHIASMTDRFAVLEFEKLNRNRNS